jgi:hypothetical protein
MLIKYYILLHILSDKNINIVLFVFKLLHFSIAKYGKIKL